MSIVLSRARRYAQLCRSEADTAWQEIKEQHDQAMVVRDVEAVVAYSSCVMKLWLGCAEAWHDWVSEDSDRYKEEHHQALADSEKVLLDTTKGILDQISRVKKLGFDVDGENEFRQTLSHLIGCTQPIDCDSKLLKRLGKLERDAIAKHKHGSLEGIAHWGE